MVHIQSAMIKVVILYIEAAYINYRIVKYVDEWCDEKVEYGVMVVMTNNPQPYVFTTVSLDKFMELTGLVE